VTSRHVIDEVGGSNRHSEGGIDAVLAVCGVTFNNNVHSFCERRERYILLTVREIDLKWTRFGLYKICLCPCCLQAVCT